MLSMMKKISLATTFFTLGVSMANGSDGWRENYLKIVMSEKKVVGSIWSAPSSLWVSMFDDGSRRDGYAQYVCLLRNDAKTPKKEFFVISIMDAKQMSAGNIKKIGRHECG